MLCPPCFHWIPPLLLLVSYCCSSNAKELLLSEYNQGSLNWADPKDPILASVIPEGWRLSSDKECRDLIWCRALAEKNMCELQGEAMLNECRNTCRNLYAGQPPHHLPDPVQEYGGVDNNLTDDFGFHVNLCSLPEGFDAAQRGLFLKFYHECQLQKPYVPKFTKRGFEKSRIPESLLLDILETREQALAAGNITDEFVEPGTVNTQAVLENDNEESWMVKVPRLAIIELQDAVKEKIFKTLGPIAEEWSGVRLQPTSVYGIRRYLNRSSLIAHLDKPWSHVISAILNIGQELEEDWPLFIKDHDGTSHKVLLKPGEMIWYESARLLHGRQWPMKGKLYDNIFLHYKPRVAWYEGEGKTRGVPPISLDLVKHAQKELKATDWTEAWSQYQDFVTNSPLEAAETMYRIGDDPYKERGKREDWKHLQ